MGSSSEESGPGRVEVDGRHVRHVGLVRQLEVAAMSVSRELMGSRAVPQRQTLSIDCSCELLSSEWGSQCSLSSSTSLDAPPGISCLQRGHSLVVDALPGLAPGPPAAAAIPTVRITPEMTMASSVIPSLEPSANQQLSRASRGSPASSEVLVKGLVGTWCAAKRPSLSQSPWVHPRPCRSDPPPRRAAVETDIPMTWVQPPTNQQVTSLS